MNIVSVKLAEVLPSPPTMNLPQYILLALGEPVRCKILCHIIFTSILAICILLIELVFWVKATTLLHVVGMALSPTLR